MVTPTEGGGDFRKGHRSRGTHASGNVAAAWLEPPTGAVDPQHRVTTAGIPFVNPDIARELLR